VVEMRFVPINDHGYEPWAPEISRPVYVPDEVDPVGARDEQSSREPKEWRGAAGCGARSRSLTELAPFVKSLGMVEGFPSPGAQRWQARHHQVPRCARTVRTSGLLHRGHGSSARP